MKKTYPDGSIVEGLPSEIAEYDRLKGVTLAPYIPYINPWPYINPCPYPYWYTAPFFTEPTWIITSTSDVKWVDADNKYYTIGNIEDFNVFSNFSVTEN
jgi:hypothetical protein